jgi:hypothetical protein
MAGVARLIIPFEQLYPPWDIVAEIASNTSHDAWMLVGGLMVQAHAMMAGLEPRVTKDVDLLIDVLADSGNLNHVIDSLLNLGFVKQEPGLRGTAFHRMKRNEQIIDVLVAEHLPSRKRQSARIDRMLLMEVPGGAQAIERKLQLTMSVIEKDYSLVIPDLLGAFVLKAAAYGSDTRNKNRHLNDVALLACLFENTSEELSRLHGSDKKRIRLVESALSNPNHNSWMILPSDYRLKGQDSLRILGSS